VAALAFQALAWRRRVEEDRRLALAWTAVVELKRDSRAGKLAFDQARREILVTIEGLASPEPRARYVRARALMYAGDFDAAERELRTALAERPDFRPGWSLLGTLTMERHSRFLLGPTRIGAFQERDGLVAAARDAFARGAPAGEARAEAARWGLPWLREDEVQANVASALQRNDATATREALRRSAQDYHAEEYALCLARIGAGLEWFDRAVEWAQGWADARFARGWARHRNGDSAGALVDFDRCIELRPDLAEAHVNRGIVHQDRGNLEAALADFDRALSLKSGFDVALVNRAQARLASDPTAADRDCTAAIDAGTRIAAAYFLRATARRKQGDLAGALADAGRYVDLQPDALAFTARGSIRHDARDLAGAIADFSRAIELQPDYADAFRNRAIVKTDLGDREGALADYERAIELGANDPHAFYVRGNRRFDGGDYEGAIADFDRSIELRSDFGEAWSNRGAAHQKRGETQAALEDFTEALRLKPDDVVSLTNRGSILEGLGEFARAVSDYEAALRLAPPDWPARSDVAARLERARARQKPR
jgi:tetratricopeptide (TPR) repeat protein